ncbi:MAG: Alpha-D-glucose-phosphate phosphatase YihX [Planctomycetota bacterium]|jgi:HAD superfamily hydrolase (TIGR01509 family)
MHQFLYFDLGNVLLDFDHLLGCGRVAEHAGVTPERVKEVVFDSGLEWRYERGEISSGEFYDAVKSRIPTVPDLPFVLDALSDIFQVKPKIETVLKSLARRGHRMGILSNTCEAHWQFVHSDRFPFLREHFEIHALSFRIGAMKPEPKIYQQALAMVGVPGEQVFFVDDRPENVRGAVEMGIDAVQFHSLELLLTDLRARDLVD